MSRSDELKALLRNYRANRQDSDFEKVLAFVNSYFLMFFNQFFTQQTDVEDTMQEFRLRVYEHRDKIDPEGNPFGWLLAVARNIKNDYFRTNLERIKRVQQLGEDAEELYAAEQDMLEEFIRLDFSGRVQERLQALNHRDRELLGLLFVEGASRKEAATQLKRSPKSIKTQREKLTKRLRVLLEGLEQS